MPAEFHSLPQREMPTTYFVGRRPYEAPEVYAVTEDDVRRLRPPRDGPLALEWHAGDAPALALSRVLLTRVACTEPPRELEERFATDVLAALSEDGFVLGSDAILRWLGEAWEPRGFAQLKPPRRRRLERLRAVFRWKTKAPITDG